VGVGDRHTATVAGDEFVALAYYGDHRTLEQDPSGLHLVLLGPIIVWCRTLVERMVLRQGPVGRVAHRVRLHYRSGPNG